MGGLEGGLEAIAGGFAGAGPGTLRPELHEELISAMLQIGVNPWGDSPTPPDTWQMPESMTVNLPSGVFTASIEYLQDFIDWFNEGNPGEITHIGGQPVSQPVVTEPPLEDEPTSIEELSSDLPGEPDYPSAVGGISTLRVLQDLGIASEGVMSWIDDLADIVGTVGDVLTTPIGTQGTVLSAALGLPTTPTTGYAQPYSYPTAPVNGVVTPAVWDMPGVDVGGQGSVSLRGGPFFQGATRLRTRRILQFRHPETGKIVWYRNMGRPILWSGDRSTVRRWNRNVGPSRRVSVTRRRKR